MASAGYRRETRRVCTKPPKSALTLRAVDLADHLRVVRSNWWKILIVAVIVGGLSYTYSREPGQGVRGRSVAQRREPGRDERASRRSRARSTSARRSTRRSETPRRSRRPPRKDQKLTSVSVDYVLSNISVSTTDTTGILEVNTTGASNDEAVKIATGVEPRAQRLRGRAAGGRAAARRSPISRSGSRRSRPRSRHPRPQNNADLRDLHPATADDRAADPVRAAAERLPSDRARRCRCPGSARSPRIRRRRACSVSSSRWSSSVRAS